MRNVSLSQRVSFTGKKSIIPTYHPGRGEVGSWNGRDYLVRLSNGTYHRSLYGYLLCQTSPYSRLGAYYQGEKTYCVVVLVGTERSVPRLGFLETSQTLCTPPCIMTVADQHGIALPTELWMKICDMEGIDKTDLGAVALVNHQLRSIAQPRLYKSFDAMSWGREVSEHRLAKTLRRFQGFLGFLKDRLEARAWVKTVSVSRGDSLEGQEEQDALLSEIFCLLPNVVSVYFMSMELSVDMINHIFFDLPRIKSVSFWNVKWPASMTDDIPLEDLLGRWPCLESLTLTLTTVHPALMKLALSPNLQSLVIFGIPS